jgi:hypothetical protein
MDIYGSAKSSHLGKTNTAPASWHPPDSQKKPRPGPTESATFRSHQGLHEAISVESGDQSPHSKATRRTVRSAQGVPRRGPVPYPLKNSGELSRVPLTRLTGQGAPCNPTCATLTPKEWSNLRREPGAQAIVRQRLPSTRRDGSARTPAERRCVEQSAVGGRQWEVGRQRRWKSHARKSISGEPKEKSRKTAPLELENRPNNHLYSHKFTLSTIRRGYSDRELCNGKRRRRKIPSSKPSRSLATRNLSSPDDSSRSERREPVEQGLTTGNPS